jgi:hypothetical protein
MNLHYPQQQYAMQSLASAPLSNAVMQDPYRAQSNLTREAMQPGLAPNLSQSPPSALPVSMAMQYPTNAQLNEHLTNPQLNLAHYSASPHNPASWPAPPHSYPMPIQLDSKSLDPTAVSGLSVPTLPGSSFVPLSNADMGPNMNSVPLVIGPSATMSQNASEAGRETTSADEPLPALAMPSQTEDSAAPSDLKQKIYLLQEKLTQMQEIARQLSEESDGEDGSYETTDEDSS